MDKFIHYTISLEIRGYDITKDEIDSIMNLDGSEFYDENSSHQRKKKTIDNYWLHNLWTYNKDADYCTFESVCERFFNDISNVMNIQTIANRISDVRLHLFMNSDLAQLHALISKRMFKYIAYYDLPMDINIISSGLVESKS